MNEHKFFINIYETFVGIYDYSCFWTSRAVSQAKEKKEKVFLYVCDATRIIMNDHKFFINIDETFVGIYVLGRAKRHRRQKKRIFLYVCDAT